jgi:hypothetical protein
VAGAADAAARSMTNGSSIAHMSARYQSTAADASRRVGYKSKEGVKRGNV